jgi:hypothetical protein
MKESHLMSVFKICFLAISLIGLLVIPTPADGQYSDVNRAAAETLDGVIFTVTVQPQSVLLGKEITLFYTVRNASDKAIYLVNETPHTFYTLDGNILVQTPIPAPVGHGEYNYRFTRIDRGKVHGGRILIPRKIYGMETFWPINVGFGYVTDKTGLNRKLRKDEDPAGLRGLLSERIKTVVVGTLSVRILEKSLGGKGSGRRPGKASY